MWLSMSHSRYLTEKAQKVATKKKSSYYRIYSSSPIGQALAENAKEAQSLVIRSGHQITKIMAQFAKNNLNCKFEYLILNKRFDVVIFDCAEISIVEIKDGSSFYDSTRRLGEGHRLAQIKAHFKEKYAQKEIKIFSCMFRAKSIEDAFKAMGGEKITKEMCLTGKMLCDMIHISFDEVCQAIDHGLNQSANTHYALYHTLTALSQEMPEKDCHQLIKKIYRRS